MKLKPWLPESRSGLSQCVQPSWCQATDPPRPGCLIHTASLNGTKSAPLTASATFSSSGWPYTRTQAGGELQRAEDDLQHELGRVRPAATGSFIFAGCRPWATLVPPSGSASGRVQPRLLARPSAPSAGRPCRSVGAPLVTGARSRISATSRSMSSSSSWSSTPSKM